MIERSELKEGMYVRLNNQLDNDTFYSKLMEGRYCQIAQPATEPDDAKIWNPCVCTIINYGMNYYQNVFNNAMNKITKKEQEKIQYILTHKDEFKDLFKIGKKINRQLNNIEELLNEIGVYHLSLWEVSDSRHFIESVKETIYWDNENADIKDYKIELEELEEMWTDLENILKQLTLLEDIHIRK